MAGRRRTGQFAGTLSALIVSDREQRMKREEADHEFERKWQQSLAEKAIESGQLVPQFSTQGGGLPRVTGFERGQPQDFQSLLMGAGQGQGASPGLLGQGGPGAGQGGFDASGYKVDFDFGPGGQLKGYSLKRKEPKERLQEEILATSRAPTSAFIPQATSFLQERLPQTPFVPGPEGGFLTSRQPLMAGENFAPGWLVGRDQVAAGLAPGLAPQLQMQRIQSLLQQGQQADLLESPTQSLIDRSTGRLIREIPRDSVLGGAKDGIVDRSEFEADLQRAHQAIANGKSPAAVRQRLLEGYPDLADEIDAALF